MNDQTPLQLLYAATLPRHSRAQIPFEQRFGRSHVETIAAMDAQGDDIPDQAPACRLTLPAMGVNRSDIPILIADPFTPGRLVQLACEVRAHAGLPAGRRGIHVSRIGDAIAGLAAQPFGSLEHYAATLCERVAEVQECEQVSVRVQGVLSYLEDVIGVKHKASIEHLTLSAEAERSAAGVGSASGLGFNHITACPCVQQTFKHSFAEPDRPLLGAISERELPLLTHSQRCRTTITIAGPGAPVPLSELLGCVDGVVFRCQNTLPREFELQLVHAAHQRPQFLEDALRDLLHAVHGMLRQTDPMRRISVQSVSMESIHDFDISGEITYTIGELNQQLTS